MPYIDGKRVSNDEWTRTYGSIEKYKTGPNGENPAEPVELDPETGAPPVAKKARNSRGPKAEKAAKAAIADALGKSPKDIEDIDVTGLDAETDVAGGDA